MQKKYSLPIIILAFGLTFAGCTAQGPARNYFERKLTWYSYIGGDDIKMACRSGAPDVHRLVYNGQYMEQVRAYDLNIDNNGGGRIETRVYENESLANFGPDLFDRLMRGRMAVSDVSTIDQANFKAALDAAPDSVRPGARLNSNQFFWIVASCRDGQFRWRAWRDTDLDLDTLSFARLLREWDRTGSAFRFQRSGGTAKPQPHSRDGELYFEILVGPNGIEARG